MCIVAEQYDEEIHRSRVMGIILGSIALGVLTGYPVGGFLYDFINKAAPFVLIAVLVLVDLGLQLTFMNFKSSIIDESPHSARVWTSLLSDHLILIILASIWLSSSAMSILEPITSNAQPLYRQPTLSRCLDISTVRSFDSNHTGIHLVILIRHVYSRTMSTDLANVTRQTRVVEIDKVGCFAIFDQEFGLVIEMFGFYLADINVIVVIVYLSMFLDNILLTVV
ncbi:synaptic vesicular amine transporter-like, partial [Diaphorina citri]|uniref:Synaptic vesicular amine transporter-like n=1 Tax=Diaphorina citri TaxID=121845 RepID=A0A3Q0JIZ5_DIACI